MAWLWTKRPLAIAQYRIQSAEPKSLKPQAVYSNALFGEWSENSLSYDSPVSTLYGEQDHPGERIWCADGI